MLLRRVIEHVKTQNWTAVVLDFVIVVVGVFIGIQVSNWNDARAEQVEERLLVLRLMDEAQQSDVAIANTVEENALRLAAARRAHAVLLVGDIKSSDVGQFEADLMSMGPWDQPGFVSATLDQAIASGAIESIRSSNVRNAIALYRMQVEQRRTAVQNLGIMNLDHVMVVRDAFDVDLSNDVPRLATPVSELLGDERLRRRIGQFVNSYSEIQKRHEMSGRMNDAYKRALVVYATEEGWVE